jgi:uncharacterized membrane protein
MRAATVMPPRLATAILSLAGIAVAGYLTIVHYQDELLVCSVGNCETVQHSKYAEIAGFPIAILGLGMYVVLFALNLLRWKRPEYTFWATVAAFAIALCGALYAAYLTYIEIAVIDAICQWCVVSAILTVLILIIEGIAVYHLLGVPTFDDDL